MNYENWLDKYYPIPANELEGDDIALINHAILKWEGLLDLDAYNLRFSNKEIIDKEHNKTILFIDGSSCTLCIKYFYRKTFYSCLCNNCPLEKILGKSCDENTPEEISLYRQAKENPRLMIDALLKAREMIEHESCTNNDDSDD